MELGKSGFALALFHIVWIVTFGTDPPALLATLVPHANTFAVDAVAPGAIDLAMTLTTQLLGLVEADLFAEIVSELGAVGGVMAVHAPDTALAVFQLHGIWNNILMHLQWTGVLVFRYWYILAVVTGHGAYG